MKKGQYLNTLLRSPQTIFSTKDISLLWGEKNESSARERLRKYVKKGQLIRLRRGIYAKDEKYNAIELATKIYTPSYISFETVLGSEGAVFQKYSQIFAASYISREVHVRGQLFIYRRIKDSILTNSKGVIKKENYYIASLERAFLDTAYLQRNYYFDNLSHIDWDAVFDIMPIYGNKSFNKRIHTLYTQKN